MLPTKGKDDEKSKLRKGTIIQWRYKAEPCQHNLIAISESRVKKVTIINGLNLGLAADIQLRSENGYSNGIGLDKKSSILRTSGPWKWRRRLC